MENQSFDFKNYIRHFKFVSQFGLKLIFIILSIMVTHAWAQKPIEVEAIYPVQIEQNQSIQLIGTVRSKHHAQVATLESGRVEELIFEVGDVVNKGQTLLTLEHQLAELQVAGAAAEVKSASLNLQEAQRLYEEVQRLSDQKVIAKTLIAERAAMLANAETELARVKAQHKLQQERLNRHELEAPFTGVVAHRSVNVGEWVTPQTPVMTLVSQNDLRLVIEIPQQHIHKLQQAESIQAKVTADAIGIKPIHTALSRWVPVSDINTRTFTAQIDIPDNVESEWIPGMSATVELSIPGQEQTAIILPQSAIKQHPDGNSSVFVVENNRAKRVVTSFKPWSENRVLIEGLPANQVYITQGVEVLKEGSLIKANITQGKMP